jgi:hypothetical protein
MRFAELQASIASVADVEIANTNLAELLHEAEWLGMLEIENMNEKPQYWLIRRRWA